MTYTLVEKKDQTVDILLNGKLEKSFKPNFDLDLSARLLGIFNNLEDVKDRKIYSFWKYEGFYILPAIQEWLYWDYFVGLVAYKDVRDYLRGKDFTIRNPDCTLIGRMQRTQNVLYKRQSFFKKIIFNSLAWFLRRRFKSTSDTLFNDDGFSGFRFKKMKLLLSRKTNFHRTEQLSFSSIKRLIYDPSVLVLGKYSIGKSRDTFNPKIVNDELSNYLDKEELDKLIESIDCKCNDILSEANSLNSILIQNAPRLLLTYDQVETALALLLAAKARNIKTISYQHGPYSRFHSGWIGYGIPEEYCNAKPDTLITWGEYWKDFLFSVSNKYDLSNTIVGSHLNKKIDYKHHSYGNKDSVKDLSNLSILIPYEFLANNLEISVYAELFLDLGWKVKIKLRPVEDSDINSDLFSFSKRVQEEVKFLTEISDEDLLNFDAVVCTQSIFGLEMMRFNVSIWYLDTSIPFLDDIVKRGFAHSLSIATVKGFKKNIEDVRPYLQPKYTLEDYKYIFSDKDLEIQIQEILS